jgi:hypothetical protein
VELARVPAWCSVSEDGYERSMIDAVRVGLPVLIGLVGLGLMILGEDDAVLGAGVVLVGVALLVALSNALMRLAIRSQADRDREAWARRYFDRHGHWPQRGAPR